MPALLSQSRPSDSPPATEPALAGGLGLAPGVTAFGWNVIPASALQTSRIPGLFAPDLVGVVISSLADLPERAILDETALADALGVKTRTIRRMVQRGELPPGILFAGRATWQAGAILRWFEARAEKAALDAGLRVEAMRKHAP